MERRKPSPFKVFRPLLLTLPKGTKEELRWRSDKRGVCGIELRVGGETFIDFDFSDWIADDGTIRHLLPANPIIPLAIDDSRVGIQGIQGASIFARWYDGSFTPELIVEGWRRHGALIPFEEIVPHLVYRDIVLMHDYYYTCMFPSWDVVLTLPAYLLLCQEIPGFQERLTVVTELGDQIRGSLKALSANRARVWDEYRRLEQFLEKLHSLEDELSLALNAHRAGLEVRFGGQGSPDFYLNSVPCEHKSRFPTIGGDDVEVRLPEDFTIVDVSRLLILEVKQAEKALEKSAIFFNNLSRTGPGMAYTEAIAKERSVGAPSSRAAARLTANFPRMMHLALQLQAEWRKVIVPYTKYAGPNSSYTAPIPIPLVKYQEAVALEHRDPRGGND